MYRNLGFLMGLFGLLPLGITDSPCSGGPGKSTKTPIFWKKTVVDTVFRSEGVAVADVNKDGKPDIIVGDVWYQAPDWKMHVIRKDRPFDPLQYSQSFACFSDDFNGDGWPDVIVIPFPGAPCPWYENPGKTSGPWKEHILSHSACNETPQYADLLGDGKRVLIMGVQPKGKDNQGQMFWLRPGPDPAKTWEHHPISDPSQPGKPIPGTFRFAHGLGVGDVNGDRKNDVLCSEGWWEHPSRQDDQPWKFHRANLGPACADMFAFDIDGDGRNDVISSSAHNFGLWWHQQKGTKNDPEFVLRDLSPGSQLVADPKNYLLNSDEKVIVDLINNHRAQKRLPPVRAVPVLCRLARRSLETKVPLSEKSIRLGYDGPASGFFQGSGAPRPEAFFKPFLTNPEVEKVILGKWKEIGVGTVRTKGETEFVFLLGNARTRPDKGIVVWEGMKKLFFSQSHALHFVDINGDGLKDLVTGRRWWAHGPTGDAGPTEPAFLFWFEARKGADGVTTFIPHLIDDDSGIGTQFAIQDINGDGLLDIIISNKKGVFVFEQARDPGIGVQPGKN